MVITCGDCGSLFRLDVALLKGEKGARVRCRRCGGHIVVRIPEESPSPPVAGVSGVFRSESASSPAPPPQETSPPPSVEAAAPTQEPTAFEADISGMFRSEPVSSPVLPPQETGPPPAVEPAAPAQEWISPWPVEASAPVPLPQPEAAGPGTDIWRQEAHDPGSADPVPSEMPGTVYSRLEDLFVSPDKEAGPDRIPPLSEEYPAGENLAEETAVTEPERKAPSRRASSRSTPLIIFVLCLLLLAGGILYFGTTKPGRERLGQLFAGWGSARTTSAPERPTYDIREVKWSFDKQTASGNLFVIKGSVVNVGNVPSAGIRIQTTLLGKDNEALAETAAFAGNPLTEALLRQMDRPGIAGAMSNRFGEGNVNREIPPGKALPFMVVFFDPPGEIAAVMVKAVDVR